MRRLSYLAAFCLGAPLCAQVERDEAARALRESVAFYLDEVSTEGGYHFAYAADLSYGRSEQAEGPTQVSIQRAGSPVVGMAYLEAWRATGERYYLDAAASVARALVRGQYCLGGWDYIIEFDPEKRERYPYRADGRCRDGAESSERYVTLDDNVTQAAMRLLMRVDQALDFGDSEIHEASIYALDKLIEAQYRNGAWPQRFNGPRDPEMGRPLKASYPESWPRVWPNEDYRDRYTLNDNTLADLIDAYLEAARVYGEPRYRAAAERGGEFLIRAQMPYPQPGWAQQYDAEMHPAWARQFEPPSITGGEARSVLAILLTLYHETGDEKYLAPIGPAIEYYRRTVLPPDDDPPARKARTCPGRTPCLARFNELRTNRPLYISKGTMVRVGGRGSFRDDGYEVTYSDESTITHYAMWVNGSWIEEIAGRLEAAKESGPVRRPAVPRGLSPWAEAEREGSRPTAEEVRRLIDSRDQRGAWVEEGTIGKADRVASVFAAEDMVVTIGGRVYELKEDETLNVYRGEIPPRERIIRSETFARNVQRLAEYLE